MLGAPPAFVLSQDQTLYKMIFITLKVLNLVHSARNRLRPVNYFFGIFKVFQNTVKRFRYKYSILFNFQGPAFASRSTSDLFILPHRPGLVKHFFSKRFQVLGLSGPLRGALRYSTTSPRNCQPPFASFFSFFFVSDTSRISGRIFGQHSENTKCSV